MAKPSVQIGNETRLMTNDELAQHELDNAAELVEREVRTDAANARATALNKLEALGLTPAEIAALIGA